MSLTCICTHWRAKKGVTIVDFIAVTKVGLQQDQKL